MSGCGHRHVGVEHLPDGNLVVDLNSKNGIPVTLHLSFVLVNHADSLSNVCKGSTVSRSTFLS